MAGQKIDFVLTWVDGNDPAWRAERAKYTADDSQDNAERRYREWENLQYWFRGVEKFAPWVNKVYFVTCGQKPAWLNTENPKLCLVSHKDIFPPEVLPIFNSGAITSNVFRIPGLSENFVLFNDDMFLTKPVAEEDFFIDGKPVDMFMEYPIIFNQASDVTAHKFVNTFNFIARHFDRKEVMKRMRGKILNLHYGKGFFYNLLMMLLPYSGFFGLLTFHLPNAFLKSSFEKVCQAEPELMETTIRHRFRSKEDINEYTARIWNILEGNFVPRNKMKQGKMFKVGENEQKLFAAIEQQKYKMVCVADNCGDAEFEAAKVRMNEAFQKILPEKSKFEK